MFGVVGCYGVQLKRSHFEFRSHCPGLVKRSPTMSGVQLRAKSLLEKLLALGTGSRDIINSELRLELRSAVFKRGTLRKYLPEDGGEDITKFEFKHDADGDEERYFSIAAEKENSLHKAITVLAEDGFGSLRELDNTPVAITLGSYSQQPGRADAWNHARCGRRV